MSLKNVCFIVIGPLETKIGKGHVSMNLTLRRLEGLIVNVSDNDDIVLHVFDCTCVLGVIIQFFIPI